MQLTYEQFLEKFKGYWEYPWNSGHDAKQDKTKPRLSVTWTVGGMGGGSCYGDAPHSPVSAESEPELTVMDDILLEIAPAMSFLQYKKLAQYMKEENKQDWEYYGNYTDYRTKYIEASDLYKALVEMNLIEEFVK